MMLCFQIQADGLFKAVGSGSSNSRKLEAQEATIFMIHLLVQLEHFTSADVYNYAPVNALITPNERTRNGCNGRNGSYRWIRFLFSGIIIEDILIKDLLQMHLLL